MVTYLGLVCDKGDSPGIQHAYPLNLAPFRKVPCDNLLDVVANVNAPDVYRTVLPAKATNTAHVISVVGEFVALRWSIDVSFPYHIYQKDGEEMMEHTPKQSSFGLNRS